MTYPPYGYMAGSACYLVLRLFLLGHVIVMIYAVFESLANSVGCITVVYSSMYVGMCACMCMCAVYDTVSCSNAY